MNNPWLYAKIDPERLKDNPYVNPTVQPPPADPPVDPSGNPDASGTPSTTYSGTHILMPRADTKAKGIAALVKQCESEKNPNHPIFVKSDGSSIYRPLTFKENIEARVKRYENAGTREEKLELFETWLDSSCAVAYKGKTGLFKLVLQSPDLITLPEDFNKAYEEVDFSKIRGIELDRTKRGVKYDEVLTLNEVLNHPAWQSALEEDKELLKKYANIVFTELKARKTDKGMGFYLVNNPQQDQLRALYVNSLNNDSNAVGYDSLNSGGRFLRRSP